VVKKDLVVFFDVVDTAGVSSKLREWRRGLVVETVQFPFLELNEFGGLGRLFK
jgi:hypothetical protein